MTIERVHAAMIDGEQTDVLTISARWIFEGGISYGDANGYLGLQGDGPIFNYDEVDYTAYARTTNVLSDVIGGVAKRALSATAETLGVNVLPATTETHNLGSSTFEWNNVYVQNAVTVSDMRRKDSLGVIDGGQALAFINALEPRFFRFKDTIVPASETAPERVITHKRPHAGFFAQHVKAAMTKAGIADCGVYAYDAESDTHALRLLEMIPFLVTGMQALQSGRTDMKILDDMAALQAEIAALRTDFDALQAQAAAAPIARVYPVKLRDRTLMISEAEALAFMSLAWASLDQGAHTIGLASGETVELGATDVDLVVRQIVAQTLPPAGES